MTEPGRKVIVAAVDGSPRSQPMLQWADEQAWLTGARLVALTACGAEPGTEGWPDDAAACAAQQVLAAAVTAALPPERAAAVELRLAPTAPAEALVAESAWAELVVLGAHHVHAAHPLHSTTAQVVRGASCPVAVVRDHRPLTTRTVVVGINGARSARPALQWAVRQAGLLGDTVDAVLAWEWEPEYPVWPYGEAEETVRSQRCAVLADELAQLPDEVRPFVQGRAVKGHPVPVLLEAARHADLLVVGVDGHGTLADRMLGVVSRRVVHHAPVPVVVVPSTVGGAAIGR